MGKTPVRMKAVIYSLSPFQQKVMPGLWKDLPAKLHHKVTENWLSATLLLGPVVGVYTEEVYQLVLLDKHKKWGCDYVKKYWAQHASIPHCHKTKYTRNIRRSCALGYVQNYQEKEKLSHRY